MTHTDVVAGQVLRIYAGADTVVPIWSSNYAFKTLESVGADEDRVQISFRMRHDFDGEYRGFVAGAGIRSGADNGTGGTKGWLFRIRLIDAPMGAEVNGVAFPFPAGYSWHTYTVVIDFTDDSLLLSVDGVHFMVGLTVNPAHQNPNLPHELGMKLAVVREIAEELAKRGIEATIESV